MIAITSAPILNRNDGIVQVHPRIGEEQDRARKQHHGQPQQSPGRGSSGDLRGGFPLQSDAEKTKIDQSDHSDGPRERRDVKTFGDRENPLGAIQCVRYGVGLEKQHS